MTHVRVYAILAIVMMGACTDSSSPSPYSASITVSPTGVTLSGGHLVQLTALVRDSRGDSFPDMAIQWTSSDTTVVSVSTAGVATARSPGVAIVTASAVGTSLNASAIITVVPAVGQVWIPFPTDTIAVGDTAHFYAIVYDTAGTELQNRVEAWSTPDTMVVRAVAVPYVGPALAIGLAPGIARVIVSVEGATDTAFVTVQ